MDEQGVLFKRKVSKQGDSLGITLPPELLEYLGIEIGDEITLTGSEKSKGRFIAIWKK